MLPEHLQQVAVEVSREREPTACCRLRLQVGCRSAVTGGRLPGSLQSFRPTLSSPPWPRNLSCRGNRRTPGRRSELRQFCRRLGHPFRSPFSAGTGSAALSVSRSSCPQRRRKPGVDPAGERQQSPPERSRRRRAAGMRAPRGTTTEEPRAGATRNPDWPKPRPCHGARGQEGLPAGGWPGFAAAPAGRGRDSAPLGPFAAPGCRRGLPPPRAPPAPPACSRPAPPADLRATSRGLRGSPAVSRPGAAPRQAGAEQGRGSPPGGAAGGRAGAGAGGGSFGGGRPRGRPDSAALAWAPLRLRSWGRINGSGCRVCCPFGALGRDGGGWGHQALELSSLGSCGAAARRKGRSMPNSPTQVPCAAQPPGITPTPTPPDPGLLSCPEDGLGACPVCFQPAPLHTGSPDFLGL